jgi:Maf1 regulator
MMDGSDFAGEKGNVWSFNFFFYNRKLKRILYFSCRGISKTSVPDSDESSFKYNSDDETDERFGMARDMELDSVE